MTTKGQEGYQEGYRELSFKGLICIVISFTLELGLLFKAYSLFSQASLWCLWYFILILVTFLLSAWLISHFGLLNTGDLDVLPDGCLVNILAKLDEPRDRAAASLVCKRWLIQTQAAFTHLQWNWFSFKTWSDKRSDATALLSQRFPNLQIFEFSQSQADLDRDIETNYQDVLMSLEGSCPALHSLLWSYNSTLTRRPVATTTSMRTEELVKSVAESSQGSFSRVHTRSLSEAVLAKVASHGLSLRSLEVTVKSVRNMVVVGRSCHLLRWLVMDIQEDDSDSWDFNADEEEVQAFEKLLSSLPCLENLTVNIQDKVPFHSALEAILRWAGIKVRSITLCGHSGYSYTETPWQKQETLNAMKAIQDKCPVLEHLSLSNLCRNASMLELSGPPGQAKKLLLTLPLSPDLVSDVLRCCPALEELVLVMLSPQVRMEKTLVLLKPIFCSLKRLTFSFKGRPGAAGPYLTLLPEEQEQQQLLDFPELSYLELDRLELEHKEIGAISRGCHKLEELVITCGSQPGFTGEAFAAARFPNLRSLQLKELRTPRIRGVGAGCPKLRSLLVLISSKSSQETKVRYGKQLMRMLKDELKDLSLLRCTLVPNFWFSISFGLQIGRSRVRVEIYHPKEGRYREF